MSDIAPSPVAKTSKQSRTLREKLAAGFVIALWAVLLVATFWPDDSVQDTILNWVICCSVAGLVINLAWWLIERPRIKRAKAEQQARADEAERASATTAENARLALIRAGNDFVAALSDNDAPVAEVHRQADTVAFIVAGDTRERVSITLHDNRLTAVYRGEMAEAAANRAARGLPIKVTSSYVVSGQFDH